MKKLTSVVLALALLLSLSACGGNQPTESPKPSSKADNTMSESPSNTNTKTPDPTPSPSPSAATPDPADENIMPPLGATVAPDQLGNSMGNLANGGMAATDGDWIYYEHERMLKRIRKDGKGQAEMTKLGSGSPYIQIIGDWVYFENSDGVQRIRVDGENKTLVLSDDEYLGNFYVMGDWIYFYSINSKTDYGIYRIRTDGTEKELLAVAFAKNISLDDGWIYYDDESEAYRIRPDGSENAKLDFSSQTLGSTHYVVDNWLIAISVGSNSLVSFKKIHVDTYEEVEVIPPDSLTYEFNVADGWLFFRYIEDEPISKVRLDGSDVTTLYTDVKGQKINVVGDWLYCQKTEVFGDDFRLKTDGSGGEFLNGDPYKASE